MLAIPLSVIFKSVVLVGPTKLLVGDAVPASSVGLAVTGGLVYGARVGCLRGVVVGLSVGATVPTIGSFDGLGVGNADGPYVRVAEGLIVIGKSVGMSVGGGVEDLLDSSVGSKVGEAVPITGLCEGGGVDDTEGSIVREVAGFCVGFPVG